MRNELLSDTPRLYMVQGAKNKFKAPDMVFGIAETDEWDGKPLIVTYRSALKTLMLRTKKDVGHNPRRDGSRA